MYDVLFCVCVYVSVGGKRVFDLLRDSSQG